MGRQKKMDVKALIAARRMAEAAVSDMDNSELKTKAFEVCLARLLDEPPLVSPIAPAKRLKPTVNTQGDSLATRIKTLKDGGFFETQRSLSDVRVELKKHGWHYPLTTLSGPMQQLVRKKELRREQDVNGKGKRWKYSNY
jgi:hypothetical protein